MPLKEGDVKVAVVRMEGTNCEEESLNSMRNEGAYAEYVHVREFISGKKNIHDYHMLFFPGGFSGGDYVRAGAIFASMIKGPLLREIVKFIEDEKVVLGVCNGFQVLVELGLLPGIGGTLSIKPQAALAPNISNRFECRWIDVRIEENNCKFLNYKAGRIISLPIAHAEGRFMLPGDKREEYLQHMIDKKQVVMRYVDPQGNYSGYPWNPNGSIYNIAGICNETGNVFGLMPHPERAYYRFQHPEFTINGGRNDGRGVFKGIMDYLKRRF
ncbi:MAG: phosphoribosylformylglycinamidine synthase subunit PurQ [Thermoplasmata archaeon]